MQEEEEKNGFSTIQVWKLLAGAPSQLPRGIISWIYFQLIQVKWNRAAVAAADAFPELTRTEISLKYLSQILSLFLVLLKSDFIEGIGKEK